MLADPSFRAKLERAGVQPDMGGGMVGQFGRDIVQSAVDLPAGAYLIGELAARSAVPGGKPAGPEIKRLVREGSQGIWNDLRHPLRHPGYTFLDLATLGTAGAAGALRAPRGVAAARRAPTRVRERVRDFRDPDPIEIAYRATIYKAAKRHEAGSARRPDSRAGTSRTIRTAVQGGRQGEP